MESRHRIFRVFSQTRAAGVYDHDDTICTHHLHYALSLSGALRIRSLENLSFKLEEVGNYKLIVSCAGVASLRSLL